MNRQEWIAKCQSWKNKWPTMQQEYLDDSKGLTIYAVIDALNAHSRPGDIFVGDAGQIYYAGPVAYKLKENQKLIWSHAQADMGWSLPGAIGVSYNTDSTVIAVIGDGSFMSNIQELATVKQNKTNTKFIVLNNGGYVSIKNTQTKYYEGRVYGTSDESGLWFPKFKDVADAFGLDYICLETFEDLSKLSDLLAIDGPIIIVCISVKEQEILPAQALKNGKQAGLHDMLPFLSDEELNREMIVKYNV